MDEQFSNIVTVSFTDSLSWCWIAWRVGAAAAFEGILQQVAVASEQDLHGVLRIPRAPLLSLTEQTGISFLRRSVSKTRWGVSKLYIPTSCTLLLKCCALWPTSSQALRFHRGCIASNPQQPRFYRPNLLASTRRHSMWVRPPFGLRAAPQKQKVRATRRKVVLSCSFI